MQPMVDRNGGGLGNVIVIVVLAAIAGYFGGAYFGLW